MDRELSFDADNFDLDLGELKELEDIVADGMIPDSRIVKIIDEIELSKEDQFDDIEDFEESEIAFSRFDLD